jgi:glycosyltransferase involved in cell wall biosynthesis
MMRCEVIVNGRFLARRVTGVERYGREILRSIGDRSRVERPRQALNGLAGHAWEQFVLPGKVRSKSVLWSPANTGPLMIRNQVLTVHDLSPLEHPEWFRPGFAAWYRLFLPHLIRRVRRVLAPSEYVKRKIEGRFAIQDVVVTSEGVDESVFHPEARQDKYEMPQRYVLFVGSLEPRKNLPALWNAWDQINGDLADTWLVIAGEPAKVFRHVELPHGMERVRFLGYIPEAHLPGLYAGATLFVLPSLDEGFGLPALEAMSCGTPVLASDGGALPEVVGDAGAIFKLSEPGGLAGAMRACLNNAGLLLSLKEKGLARAGKFTWQAAAERVWNVLNEI